MSKVFLGIDPGASGGLAESGTQGARAVPMPDTEKDVWTWFRDRSLGGDVFAVIEQVGGFIAGAAHPGSAMFKFGQSYGGLRMALIAAGIPFEAVTPQKWMKEFGLTRRKDEQKTSFKNRAKSIAQGLFPSEKVTLATADALLIAEYARRKYSVKEHGN